MECAERIGLPASCLTPDGIEFWGKINFLKAGIRYADRITTVSHTYAREILTPHFGMGSMACSTTARAALGAIPNGIDTDAWSPPPTAAAAAL
jgi:starch synthase